MTKRIEEYFPKGVTVHREVLMESRDYRNRKIRIVQTIAVEFHATTPADVRTSWNRTVGRKYLERFINRSRYDAARWITLGKNELAEYPEITLV